jgi:putative addiction module killer protein
MELESTKAFDRWIDGMRDFVGRARIQARIERLRQGNPGHHRTLIGGIVELKIDCGPGYRIYYAQRGTVLIILLAGGNKSTQKQDIRKAIALARGL